MLAYYIMRYANYNIAPLYNKIGQHCLLISLVIIYELMISSLRDRGYRRSRSAMVRAINFTCLEYHAAAKKLYATISIAKIPVDF